MCKNIISNVSEHTVLFLDNGTTMQKKKLNKNLTYDKTSLWLGSIHEIYQRLWSIDSQNFQPRNRKFRNVNGKIISYDKTYVRLMFERDRKTSSA